MSERFDLLALALFQKKMEACSLEEIQQLASQYPYFAPAQLLLAKKSKALSAPGTGNTVQKAVLYFPDALAFDLFLNEERYTSAQLLVPEEVVEPLVPQQVPETGGLNKPFSFKLDLSGPEEAEEEEGIEEETETAEPEARAEQTPVKAPAADPLLPAPPVEEALPVPVTDNLLTFEPFHTVDYFASQGIKLSQEETAAPKDQVGRQLKSFTEWLKTMKRLPAEQQAKGLDRAAERKVETLAAHSVETSAIITEAMAEVWAKQGNREKAVEIYTKLGALYPARKAYFAGKAEKLK